MEHLQPWENLSHLAHFSPCQYFTLPFEKLSKENCELYFHRQIFVLKIRLACGELRILIPCQHNQFSDWSPSSRLLDYYTACGWTDCLDIKHQKRVFVNLQDKALFELIIIFSLFLAVSCVSRQLPNLERKHSPA